MAGSVLTEQYVDIVTRNLRETMDALRAIQKQADATGEALKRMKGQSSGGASSAAGVVSPKGAAPGGVGAMIGAAAGPIGIATAAVTGLVVKGLQGTAELEQFGMAMMNVAREVGNLVAPALRLVTDIINTLTQSFRSMGGAGQQMLLMSLGPIGVMLEVISKSGVQAAIMMLVNAFVRMSAVLQPIRNVIANIQEALLDAFVVQPLVWFIDQLTTAVLVMTELAKRAVEVARAVAGFVGLGNLFNTPKRTRTEATLNQTGTEDASGTFQRIQQAIFKASAGAEGMDVQDKQLAKMEEIATKANEILTVINLIFGVVGELVKNIAIGASVPASIAQGGVAAAGVGGNVALGAVKNFFGIR